MSEFKYKNCILASIDHLRARKSRPDIHRICKFMLKCYRISPKATRQYLRWCVEEKTVVKVDYKDNISYRNATNCRRDKKKTDIKEDMSSSSLNSERRLITSAIATLIYQDQTYLEHGISFDDLIKAAASQEVTFTKKQLENIIQNEISSGSLVRLSNGNLALGPADHDGDSSDSVKFEYNIDTITKLPSSANSSQRSSPLRMRGRPRKHGGSVGTNNVSTLISKSSAVRVGERRKMAKKVFDPSENNAPLKRKRGRPIGSLNKSTIRRRMLSCENSRRDNVSMPRSESQPSADGSTDEIEQEEVTGSETSGGVCSVCLVQKPRGSNDRLVECRDCSNKAHTSCLQSGSGMLKLRPDNTWQCPHCKTCVICCETNDAGVLTVCSICSDAYHALCHSPRIPERLKAWDQWECKNCLESRPIVSSSPATIQNSITTLRNSPTLDPFLKPHELDRAQSKMSEKMPIDPTIPEIGNWTTNDVYEYFIEHLPEAAPVLKEQDMDGQALSVARRSDIVRGLGLPLGPALALYRIIVKLQTRIDDWTMCWG